MTTVALALACFCGQPAGDAKDAAKILESATVYLASLKSFKADVTADYVAVLPKGDKKLTGKTMYTLAVQRPNKLALILTRAEADGKIEFDGKKLEQDPKFFALDIVCDGKDFYYYLSPLRSPAKSSSAAPADLDVLTVDWIRIEWELGLIKNEVVTLVHTKPEASFAGQLSKATRTGQDEVDSVKCRRVAQENTFKAPDGKDLKTSVELWIEDSATPKLRKYALKEPGYSMTITFSNWAIDPALGDADFKLPPMIER